MSEIYHGADDNASGVAGAMEIARAMTLLPKAPRRSIVFAFWDAEEIGLHGSRYWAEHPTVPIDHVVFGLNLDMIGRLQDNQVIVWGTGSGVGLRGLVDRCNVPAGLSIDFRPSVLTAEDGYSLFVKGIPVVFPWTGLHPQYHRPDDTVEHLNLDGMQRVVRFAHSLVYDVANGAEKPVFREASRREIERSPTARDLPPFPKPGDLGFNVGFSCRRHEAEPGSLIVVKVAAKTPAAAAGLQPADRICRVDGRPVTESLDLKPFFQSPARHVSLLVEREGRYDRLELDPKSGSLRAPSAIAADVLDRLEVPQGGAEELLTFVQALQGARQKAMQTYEAARTQAQASAEARKEAFAEYSRHLGRVQQAERAAAERIIQTEKDPLSEAYQAAAEVLLPGRVNALAKAAPDEQRVR